MSDQGFGRGKTVILPNPAGRRPTARKEGEAAGTPAPAPPQVDDTWGTPAPPTPGAGPAQVGDGGPAIDPDISPVAAAALLRSEAALNANEMVRAAQPLLLTLAKLRSGLVRAQSALLMEQVAANIENFESAVTAAGFSADQTRVGKYALCATADDVVQNIPVDDRSLWTQHSMLSRFFGERIGGVRFFDELTRMKADPLNNVSVLELMHACIAAGFEGVYRTTPGGLAQLQQIQRDVYDVIRRVRPRESNELSPRWQGATIKPADIRNRVPTWVIASLALFLIVGTFVGYRWLLAGDANQVADELLALYPLDGVQIAREPYQPRRVPVPPTPPQRTPPSEAAAPPPPPRTDQGERIRTALAGDIQSGRAVFDDTGGEIRITVGDIVGLVLFTSGSTIVTDNYKPTLDRIGRALNREPGPITIIGHTDSVPIRSVRFPSNYELSVARAEAVADILRTHLEIDRPITVRGRGPDQPIDSNATREGRARNRRVDMIIPRIDQ